MKSMQIPKKRSLKRFTALLLSLLLVVGDTGFGGITVRAEDMNVETQSENGSEKMGGWNPQI